MIHHLLAAQRSLNPSRLRSWQQGIKLSIILGITATITAITLIILGVSRFVENIHIDVDPQHWSYQARVQVYGLCYNGCADCLDPSVITTACRKTIQAKVPGLSCDASEKWWWADEAAKYPKECLLLIGEQLRVEEEANRKFWWRALYLLVVLAIPLGYGVYLGSEWMLARLIRWGEEREQQTTSSSSQGQQLQASPPRSLRGPRKINSTTPLLAVAIVAVMLPTQVQAFNCITHPTHNQLFSNPSGTIHGVIHGWLSNCYYESYSCGETCSTTSSSGYRSCDTNWCERQRPDRIPRDYVAYAIPYVQGCGFNIVDHVPVTVGKRIPNSNIEERFRVKISVNSFNGSEGLDVGVKCLYDMIELPQW